MQSHLCCPDTDAPCVEDSTVAAFLFKHEEKKKPQQQTGRN